MALSFVPVECKYVTEECIREWRTAGSNFKSQHLQQPLPVGRFIYELFWTMVRGELPLSKCRIALESVEYLEKQARDNMPSVLADTIAHMGQEIALPGEFRGRLLELAKWLVDSALVSVRLLQERCEAEFLWEAEMIKIKSAELKAKEVRVNTRLLYQQTKFNLLREESEGYAKLVTLLCQLCHGESTKRSSTAIISAVKSLIGHFDLDPNRVFDIVLECFELQPENDCFLELIPMFPKAHAAHILGCKFQYYQRTEVNEVVPDSLYRLTAAMVKAEFISLDGIYAHLLPKDELAIEHYEEFTKKRVDDANKIGKINLAATGKDLMEEEKPGDVSIDLFAALDMETEAVSERLGELATNQKLGLLKGFLDVNDWYHAHLLLERLSSLNPVEHKPICDGLMRCIEMSISRAYSTLKPMHLFSSHPSRHGDPSAHITDLPPETFQMLACIGPYLHRDTILLQKVCRVLKAYFSSVLASVAGHCQEQGEIHDGKDSRTMLREARLNVEEALSTCLLPSLQLIPANPAIDLEIWEVLSLLPYEVRYRLYGDWEREDERNPLLLAARLTAKLDTRRILKRLAKENLKQLGRMVAKIAHANPMTVLRTIVHQIEAYKDMIAPVVDAFKYLTQLEYDILEYVVIERLVQRGREKLKDDGLNLSDWLQSLASFWGHLCKKYPSMELRGLFQYLVNQLKRGEGIELVLLQELIQQMANVQYTENMTEDQLDALAGGEALRYQATSFGITRNNKTLTKSTNRLRDALLPKDEPKLALPLLLLIAQHRSIVVIKATGSHIKMVSEQFDRCHGTLLQYVEFLTNAVTPADAYAELIPTLDELVHKYHLDPEVAFLIYRPVMRLFKPSKDSDNSWPADMPKSRAQTESIKEKSQSDLPDELILNIGVNRKPTKWSELLATVKSMLPTKSWNSLSPELYITFWGLTLYDIYVPRKRYESEIAKQQSALKALEEISDNSHNAIAKRKKDKERIQDLLDRLSTELQKQEQNVATVHQRLVLEKDSWLTSCPDSLKINMEFLQRCIFPRCVLSMTDAVYCAKFVHALHSLGTPFFNTVNHIDVLICKALPPMICCCTEFEAARLGRFLYETLKMAYYWKSDETIYERECGNMPGFAVYYRDPNSQRVTFAQYIKVHWKWSGRITRLLIQCLESNEYMDIRNALIILTKISSVFPVTRKSGINLEKRVIKIKADEREDLKVLATGVAAALAARKSSWISEEEFNMGYIDIKPSASPAKGLPAVTSSVAAAGFSTATVNPADAGVSIADQANRNPKTLTADGRLERPEITSANIRPEQHAAINLTTVSSQGTSVKSAVPGSVRKDDDSTKVTATHGATAGPRPDELSSKNVSKTATTELESRSQVRRTGQASTARQSKLDSESKAGKTLGRSTLGVSANDKEARQSGAVTLNNGASVPASATEFKGPRDHDADGDETQERASGMSGRLVKSPHREGSVSRSADDTLKEKPQKRVNAIDEVERANKRRKVDTEDKGDHSENRTQHEKTAIDEHNIDKVADKILDRNKDRAGDRAERDYKNEKSERSERCRSVEHLGERTRDRSLERLREKSADRVQDRVSDRVKDEKTKEDRTRPRYNESSIEKPHPDDRFPMQNLPPQSLPPPPPLPPHMVPQSLPVGRREDDADRRGTANRNIQRASPRREEKPEKRRSEEANITGVDDAKRRREEEYRKREERESLPVKNEKDRDKSFLKEELDGGQASKRRRIKRDHLPEGPANYGPSPAQAPSMPASMPQPFDVRERERKEPLLQRGVYLEEGGYDKPSRGVHKEAGKVARRDHELPYNREWEDEKRQRNDPKRRHHRK